MCTGGLLAGAGESRLALERSARGHLYTSVVVLVHPADQTGVLPVIEPAGQLFVFRAVHGFDQIGTREGPYRRSGGVQQGDEEQGPAGTDPGITYTRYSEETHDNVRQAGGPAHQGGGDKEHVDGGFAAVGIGAEAKLLNHLIQAFQKIDASVVTGGIQHRGAKAGLWQYVSGHHDGQEYRRHQESENQHAILSDLSVGNAFHATQYGVEEHDGHADDHADVHIHFQEAGEHDANAAHLPGHIGERYEYHTNHRHRPGHVGVVTVTDEIRHGKLAELAQVRRQKHRQEDITTSPSHQVYGGVIAGVGDNPSHGNKGRGGHPVRGRGGTIGHRGNPTAGHVELLGGTGPRPDRDTNIERERRAHENICQKLDIHTLILIVIELVYCSSTSNFLSSLFMEWAYMTISTRNT